LTLGGLFTTVTGTLLLTGGLVIDDPDKSLNVSLTGTFIVLGGLVVTLVGIPVGVSGANRKRGIEVELNKFIPKGSASINGIGLTIRF
jgi:hypothetical protein